MRKMDSVLFSARAPTQLVKIVFMIFSIIRTLESWMQKNIYRARLKSMAQ